MRHYDEGQLTRPLFALTIMHAMCTIAPLFGGFFRPDHDPPCGTMRVPA
jgi:hypothetical protein